MEIMNKRKMLQFITVCLMLLTASQSFGQKVNFTGNWRYSFQKSDLTSYPDYLFPAELLVKMSLDSISLSSLIDGLNKFNIPVNYPLNGETKEKTYPMDMKRFTSWQIATSKESLIKTSKLTKGQQLVRITREDWTLSADKRVLTILLKEEGPNEKPFIIKGVFEVN